MSKWITGLIVFLLYDSQVLARTQCKHRDYGFGSTVCVCNEHYCDDLDEVKQTARGVVTVYSTSKIGDRFNSTQLHFIATPIQNHNATLLVKINREKLFQKIIGFGGAFTDSSGINIASLPTAVQRHLINDYFASNGLEYSLARVPIGGTDFSPRLYSYDDHPGDDTLAKFALQPEDLHFKVPYINLAKQVSTHGFKLFGSTWSPPAWFKTNHKMTNGGFLLGQPGGKYYKLFAKYLVRFVEEYGKNNVTLWGITVENEPNFGWLPIYPNLCLGFNGTLQRDFIKYDLGPSLHQAGFQDLKVMIYDDNINTMIPSFNLFNFASTVYEDPEAAKYVAGAAFHWYNNNKSIRGNLTELHNKFPSYFLLSTEACEQWANREHKVALGDWATFNRYAEDIIEDLKHYAAGWTDWNMVLDTDGGPSWVNNKVDAPIIVNTTSREYYKQPFFYALGHFSKFLVPDSVRVSLSETNSDLENVLVVAFMRPDQGMVIIILNKNNHSVKFTIDDPKRGHLLHTIKSDSMQTLLWY